MKILYKTSATSTGGREGRSISADRILDVKLAPAKELGGPGGATNPEQLFAAGYSACFLSAMKFVAGKEKLRFPPDTTVTAEVGLGEITGGFALDIELRISLPGLARADAESLANKAHHVCPYSNATRGNVDVRLVIV